MSTIPPVPAGDPTFSPNPDIDLDLNAAAAAGSFPAIFGERATTVETAEERRQFIVQTGDPARGFRTARRNRRGRAQRFRWKHRRAHRAPASSFVHAAVLLCAAAISSSVHFHSFTALMKARA